MLVGRAHPESLSAIADREHSIRDVAALGDSQVHHGPRRLENVGRQTPTAFSSGNGTE